MGWEEDIGSFMYYVKKNKYDQIIKNKTRRRSILESGDMLKYPSLMVLIFQISRYVFLENSLFFEDDMSKKLRIYKLEDKNPNI